MAPMLLSLLFGTPDIVVRTYTPSLQGIKQHPQPHIRVITFTQTTKPHTLKGKSARLPEVIGDRPRKHPKVR